jgi:uncharacterized protein (DUF1330 family)
VVTPMPDSRVVTWYGLEVSNQEGYSRYRAEMTPILEAYGGRFDQDFVVSKVLRTTGSALINRVFAISFPDAGSRDDFFADPTYRGVRALHFDGSVATVDELDRE